MTKMKNLLLLTAVALASACFVSAQNPATTTTHEPLKLVIEVEVPAPLSDVWRAFSTSEGLSTWLAPDSAVDLRAGGDWVFPFPGGGTDGGTLMQSVLQKKNEPVPREPRRFTQLEADRQ